jgi:methyltransferase (TIGR00027 family)
MLTMPRMRPSLTAIKLARVLVFLGYHEVVGPLLPAGAADASEALLRACGHLKPWMLRFYESPARRAWLERTGDRFGPGQTLRMGLRKRFMDDEVRSALAEGARQVLVIGAGYDTLCMRLAAEFPDRRFVEIDHPATSDDKRRGLEALARTRDNLQLLGVDLATSSLADALERAGWVAQARSVIVAEGVLMYLPREAVAATLACLRAHTGPGSRVVFTYLHADAQGRATLGKAGWLTRLSLRLLGERLHWCVPDERALADFVAEQGWRWIDAPQRYDLGARFLIPAGYDDSEYAKPFEFMAVIESDQSR